MVREKSKRKSESEIPQLCLTLCNPMDYSPPGSSVHGILQARILEWVAISFSRGSYQPRDRIWVSRIAGRLFNLWATREDSINTYTMLNKTPLLHQSSGPHIFLSLSLLGWFPGAQRPSEFTFLPGLLRPSWEGALCLHPIERAPEAFVNRASPVSRSLLVFCINQGISASFSLLYLLIINSRPPGSGPLKGLNIYHSK